MEYGYCQCGCGQKTQIAHINRTARGWVKGEPKRFVAGHGNTGRPSKVVAFFAYVAPGKKNECWLWQGTKDKAGYGVVGYQRKSLKAHRLSYEIYYGDPGLLHVLHKCDNPACVNPNHLFLGTNEDNIIDAVKKGGANHTIRPSSRFTSDDIEDMFAMYASGATQYQIAKKYQVNQSFISRVLNKKRIRK